jgi:acyl-coenzyme A synthetase/AMP-(fatty) acid ligase/acyl carrier protein
LENFLPLVAGATLVIADQDTVADGEALVQTIDEFKVTMMQATPTTWQLLMAYGWQGHPSLKILCGGEAMSQELAGQLVARGASVWNMYGPTETTIWSTVQRITGGDAPVSIGKPIHNTQCHVLDEQMQPVAVGAYGELFIGGAGLARGYHDRPELTADRFVADPFSTDAEARLYRTGDRVQYRDDGCLMFLGRFDDQIKLRGFRIEIGEIDSLLRSHDAVDDAVTIVREDTPGDQRLVGYVISTLAEVQHELREYLQMSLPNYMVPAAIVALDVFPVTPNGKLDRKALPAPVPVTTTAAERAENFEIPLTETEQSVAGIWAEVLGFDAIEPDDNFFDLGGHSLQAVQIIARMKADMGVRVRPTDLMYQTLRQLAASCGGEPSGDGDAGSGGILGTIRRTLVRD